MTNTNEKRNQTDGQIKVDTPQGIIVATPTHNPDYPGIFIDTEKNGAVHPLVLVDYTDGTIKVRIWDGNNEHEDYQFVHTVIPT